MSNEPAAAAAELDLVSVTRESLEEASRVTGKQLQQIEQQITQLQLQRARILGRLEFIQRLISPSPDEPNGSP